MKILLVASDKSELKGFDSSYIKCVCGVGPIMAAVNTCYAIDAYSPDVVISVGSAGANNLMLEIGNAYSFSSVITPDQDLSAVHVPLGSTLDEKRTTLGELYSNDSKSGLMLLSSGRFSNKTFDYHIKLNPDASDMEGYGVALSASKKGLPFYLVKLITDRVGDDSGIAKVNFELRKARENLIQQVAGITSKL